VNSVDFNSDCSVIASASYDATVKLWDCRSHQSRPIQSLSDAKDSVESVVIKNHEILSGSVDGCIRQYDIRMGMMTCDPVQHPVTSVAYSNDHNCILASTLNSTLVLIDKELGECLNEYKGHINTNYRISGGFSASDDVIVSGSEDGKVYYWDLVNAKPLRILEAHSKPVSCTVLNSKRNELLCGSYDGTMSVWVDDSLYEKFMAETNR
jgi:mitogen-activated protein kinase organizer 1